MPFFKNIKVYAPAQETIWFFASARIEGSDKPVHTQSVARAFDFRIHKVWKKRLASSLEHRHRAPLDTSPCAF